MGGPLFRQLRALNFWIIGSYLFALSLPTYGENPRLRLQQLRLQKPTQQNRQTQQKQKRRRQRDTNAGANAESEEAKENPAKKRELADRKGQVGFQAGKGNGGGGSGVPLPFAWVGCIFVDPDYSDDEVNQMVAGMVRIATACQVSFVPEIFKIKDANYPDDPNFINTSGKISCNLQDKYKDLEKFSVMSAVKKTYKDTAAKMCYPPPPPGQSYKPTAGCAELGPPGPGVDPNDVTNWTNSNSGHGGGSAGATGARASILVSSGVVGTTASHEMFGHNVLGRPNGPEYGLGIGKFPSEPGYGSGQGPKDQFSEEGCAIFRSNAVDNSDKRFASDVNRDRYYKQSSRKEVSYGIPLFKTGKGGRYAKIPSRPIAQTVGEESRGTSGHPKTTGSQSTPQQNVNFVENNVSLATSQKEEEFISIKFGDSVASTDSLDSFDLGGSSVFSEDVAASGGSDGLQYNEEAAKATSNESTGSLSGINPERREPQNPNYNRQESEIYASSSQAGEVEFDTTNPFENGDPKKRDRERGRQSVTVTLSGADTRREPATQKSQPPQFPSVALDPLPSSGGGDAEFFSDTGKSLSIPEF